MPPQLRSKKNKEELGATVHAHRTAKVVEMVCTSSKSFEDAIEKGLKDAAQTTRGITGADICHMNVRCDDGKIVGYTVDMKVAFGVDRTRKP